MGVPKFFRWLSERYPCLCEELKEYQIPEFDNLYLDMNGIIHVCSHPNDFDPHFRISEEKIFTDIFHYIEVLFRLIRPKKLFFMAVDGVAPRAKMNQQRGRRFSSAKEAENLEKKALEKGESLPKEKRFDSNCITPGTSFMTKLQEQLKYFVANKISNDKLWRQPTIILSGHSVPGEGEHKIMDYIRYLRSQPDWDPHTRHCLYGLDADLIILGLCTHEPNFSLLREEVKFVKTSKTNQRTATPETINYNLLHLSLLRGYLDLEFQALKNSLPFPYDLENVIDDWVLMGFLVGNDFIPHLPHLHIHCNALGILYDTYRAVLPKLDGYINEGGVLNLARFEKFLTELSQFDMEHFNETYADMKFLESKTGKKHFPESNTEEEGGNKAKTDDDLSALIRSSELEMFCFEDDDSSLDGALEPDGLETIVAECEEDKLFFKEFKSHKRDYYMNKMEYPSVSPEVLKKEAEGYVTALQWILSYYYKGCPSWSWYYPHHYSPYVSDLRGFASSLVSFDRSTPFLPFQQLLAVLPAASREFLPKPYQKLMVCKESPIIDYFPSDFKFDLNGKRMEWEAVVLIPFIDEKRLLDAMSPLSDLLTEDEKIRNSHGPMQVYNYSSESLGTYSAPNYFPDIASNHAKCVNIFPSEVAVDPKKVVTGRHPSLSDSVSIYMAGFPVLSTLEITGTLEKKGVKVFEHPSRGENMILRIKERAALKKPLEQLSQDVFERDHIYVSYPHLTPAKVNIVMSQGFKAEQDSEGKIVVEKLSFGTQNLLQRKLTTIIDTHLNKWGIDLSKCDTVVYAQPLEGTKMKFSKNGTGFIDMIWSEETVGYPLDTLLFEVNQREEEKRKFQATLPLSDVFPPTTLAYMIGPVDYGSRVEVKSMTNDHRLQVDLLKTSEPDLHRVRKEIDSCSTNYYPGYACAQMLGISSHLFSRLTSIILVQSPHTESDKTNIGLSLKATKTNQQMVGFTKKEGKIWLYSDKALQLVRDYMEKFVNVFEYLAMNVKEDIFFKDKMFPNEDSATCLTEVRNWLKGLEKGELRSVESQLIECNAIKVLEEVIDEYSEEELQLKTIKLCPHHLYLPKPDLMISAPDPEAEHKMLDRIVFVRECHSIPLGSKGTIIGIEKKASKSVHCDTVKWEEAATLYDVLFDKEIIGGQALYGCSKKRIYRLNKQVFINISYGFRMHRSPVSHNDKNNGIGSQSNHTGGKRNQSRMSSFNQSSSGNQKSNSSQKTSGNTGSEPPPIKQSGSVTNFFNAYRNNANTNEGTGQERGQNVSRVANVPSSNNNVAPPQQSVSDPASLHDMWYLLKNLQFKNSEATDSENNQNQNVAGSFNQSVILSQTFTRSMSSQQNQPQQQAAPDNRAPTGNTALPNVQQFQNSNSQSSVASPPQTSSQCVEQTEALKKILCINSAGISNVPENNNFESNRRGGQRSNDQIKMLMDSVGDGNKMKRWSAPVVHSSGVFTAQGAANVPTGRLCGHLPSCMTYFCNLCTLYRMKDPVQWLNTSEVGVIASCRLGDGFQFCGPAKNTSAQAKEAMACEGIRILSERYGPPKDPNTLQNARRHLGLYQLPQPSQLLVNSNRGNTGQNRGPGFVPPQASRTSKHGVRSAETHDKRTQNDLKNLGQQTHSQMSESVFHDQHQNREDSRNDGGKKRGNRRKMRIAANFHNPGNQN